MYKLFEKAFNLPINFDPYSSQSFTTPLKTITMGWEPPFYNPKFVCMMIKQKAM